MADILPSVAATAKLGLELSTTLRSYYEANSEAWEMISNIDDEVSSTANSLQQLRDLLVKDAKRVLEGPIGSVPAMKSAGIEGIEELAKQCNAVFNAIRIMINLANVRKAVLEGPEGEAARAKAEAAPLQSNMLHLKLRWRWLDPRIKRLQEQMTYLKLRLVFTSQALNLAIYQLTSGERSAGTFDEEIGLRILLVGMQRRQQQYVHSVAKRQHERKVTEEEEKKSKEKKLDDYFDGMNKSSESVVIVEEVPAPPAPAKVKNPWHPGPPLMVGPSSNAAPLPAPAFIPLGPAPVMNTPIPMDTPVPSYTEACGPNVPKVDDKKDKATETEDVKDSVLANGFQESVPAKTSRGPFSWFSRRETKVVDPWADAVVDAWLIDLNRYGPDATSQMNFGEDNIKESLKRTLRARAEAKQTLMEQFLALNVHHRQKVRSMLEQETNGTSVTGRMRGTCVAMDVIGTEIRTDRVVLYFLRELPPVVKPSKKPVGFTVSWMFRFGSKKFMEMKKFEDAKVAEVRGKDGKLPIRLKDAVGRKFTFPWEKAHTWQGMKELVDSAFRHVDVIGPHVMEGHYDLLGPNGDIFLPELWESLIKPDTAVTMHMWPMDKIALRGPHPARPPMGMPGPRPGPPNAPPGILPPRHSGRPIPLPPPPRARAPLITVESRRKGKHYDSDTESIRSTESGKSGTTWSSRTDSTRRYGARKYKREEGDEIMYVIDFEAEEKRLKTMDASALLAEWTNAVDPSNKRIDRELDSDDDSDDDDATTVSTWSSSSSGLTERSIKNRRRR